MRRISFGLAAVSLCALVFAACGGETVTPPTTPTPPVATTPPEPTPPAPTPSEPAKPAPTLAELQKKAGEGIGAAINAHDPKKIASFYTENATIKFAGMPDLTGRDAIEQMWTKNFAGAKDSKSMANRIWVKGDVVVVEWAWAGVHSGDMMGVKATEKPVGMQGVDIMWFTPEGLVKEQHTYADVGTIMSQIGVSKQKGRPVPAIPTAPTVVVSTNGDNEAKNVDLAKKMFGAFEKKSDADFLGNASDDIQWDDMTMPETMKGKAAGKKFFADMTKAFPDVKVENPNVWGIGDFVIAEGTLSGTHKGAFMGIQPTKKSINLHGVDIVQVKDGKIVRGWSYANGGEMMMQLGLMPPPGAKDAKPAAGKTDAKPATPAAPAKPATPAAPPAKK